MTNEKGSLWMAARIARTLTGTARPKVNPVLNPLIVVHRKFHPKADLDLLNLAYETAERLHAGVTRKSGEPYITHPLAVATIAAEIGMDTTTLVAALLHDTVEDTDYSLEELTADFGEEVARLVDGVTKLDKVALGSAAEAETVRKMIVAMANDPRVLVIKVCDRLHNMRTMRFLPPEKQAKKARETLEVIAPLAHRLGMATVKWELEDLAFAILYPRKYEEIVRIVADRAPKRDQYIARVKEEVESTMRENGINAEVVGRPKHYWSIYQKMIVRGRDFDEIFDLVGIRILVETVRDCYAAVGSVHSLYQPMPGRFKDYISSPRFGVYKSLHTTVLGPDAKPLEIQIRTLEMHRNAEFGIAAHWRYKETRGTHKGAREDLDQMAWMRQLLDWQKEAADPNEFLDSLRYDLSTDQIFAFTPKGDAITLPTGATPVDFAYAVHTEVGHRCIGAKVNGRLVALESPLNTGDKVEIFTSKDQSAGPSKDWLNFVVAPRARAKIRQWFAKERRGEAVELGRDALAQEVQRSGQPVHRIFTPESVRGLASDLGFSDVDGLYAAVGNHELTAGHVVHQLVDRFGKEDEPSSVPPSEIPVHSASRIANTPQEGRGDGSGILVQGEADFSAKLAKCCTPVPGDSIFGYITKGGGVSVHRTDCTNAAKLHQDDERIIEVGWARSFANAVFLVTVQIEGLDRNGLLSEVTRVISEQKVPITATSSRTSEDRVAMIRFTFEVSDTKQLGYLMSQLRNIEGVFDVYRVTTGG